MTTVIYSYRNYFKKLNKKYDLTSSCNDARIEAVAPETSALANTTFRSLKREMRERQNVQKNDHDSHETNSPMTLEYSPLHALTPSHASLEIALTPVRTAQLPTPRQLELEMVVLPTDPAQLRF
jgi:hypothetical protein